MQKVLERDSEIHEVIEAQHRRQRRETEQAVTPYVELLFTAALRLTRGDSGYAETLVRETLTQAFEEGMPKPNARVKPWLLSALRRAFIEYSSGVRGHEVLRTSMEPSPSFISIGN